MRRIIIATILLLSCSATNAEWRKVFVWSNSSISYIEDSTTSAQGQFRYAWTLINYAQRRDDGSRSMRRQIQIDCNSGQARYLDLSTYASPWASGVVVSQMNASTGWFQISSRNAGEDNDFKFSTFKFLCG